MEPHGNTPAVPHASRPLLSAAMNLSQVPGMMSPQVRPPFDGDLLPLPGASDVPVAHGSEPRRTAQNRAIISPTGEPGQPDGYAMTHPYVRRFWVAAIGPGAVADLLRLAAAAQSGRSLRTPTHLGVLIRYGLVRRRGSVLVVPETAPPLPKDLKDRLTPHVRQQLFADERSRKAV